MEKQYIYTELFNNTKGCMAKEIISSSASLGDTVPNKFAQFVNAIGDFNITGFGVSYIDESLVIFERQSTVLETFKFKIKEDNSLEILDFEDGTHDTIESAVQVSIDKNYRKHLLLEVSINGKYAIETIFNVNIKTASEKEASKWASEQESNCELMFVKEGVDGKPVILPNEDSYLQIREVIFGFLKDVNQPFSDENFEAVSTLQFMADLDANTDTDQPFLCAGKGTFVLVKSPIQPVK